MRCRGALSGAWFALAFPAAAHAQTLCTSEDNRIRIEDAHSRIFARPAQVDYEGAERGLRFAMRDCPTDPQVHGLMGLALLGMQSYVLAEQHLQAASAFHDLNPAWWRENGPVVTARLAQLRQTLGSVLVTADVPGAVLHLPDERAVVLPMREPVRVPAGRYTLRVTAPGHRDVTREVEVGPDRVLRESVTLPELPQPPVSQPGSPLVIEVREVRRASPWRTVGWVTAGVGVAAIVAGAVQWTNSDAQREHAVSARADTPDAWGAWARYSYALDTTDGASICGRAVLEGSADARAVQDLCAENQQARVMAWAFTVLGAALAGGGVAMALLAQDRVEDSRSTARVTASPGPSPRVSLEVSF